MRDTMRARLDEMPDDQRTEVETASKLLRRARAARQLPIVPITPAAPA
ncbi:hypothetical protein [Leekyejoonella antrihumi]|nr:hypothetical protein [Leekyejoonella antrihumi]